MSTLIEELKKSKPNTDGPILDNLICEYQKIILRSLVTTFGLDFIIKDQIGGDVDTVHNVRNNIKFKNQQNSIAYENRGPYDSNKYRNNNTLYRQMVKKGKKQQAIEDAYVPNQTIYYGKASYLENNPEKRASIDHIVSAHEVHNDPGRILAGLDGADLANASENLHYTNSSLNNSKKNLTTDEYLSIKDKNLSEETKIRMKELDDKSRKSMSKQINEAYYSSDRFYNDAINASHKLGVQMAKREAIGFVMVEIFFSCKNRMELVNPGATFNDYFNAINQGINDGLNNLKSNFGIVLNVLGEGYMSGVIASISTTLINTFITTNTTLIKNIRTASVTLVRATNVLLLNPGNLLLGDRYKATTIIITTGISSIVGVSIGDSLRKSPLMLIPEVGDKFGIFLQLMITGMLSFTFLHMIDKSKHINDILIYFNKYAPVGYDIGYYSNEFEKISAQLNNYDIEKFVSDCKRYDDVLQMTLDDPNESTFEKNIDCKLKELDIEMDDLDAFLDGEKTTFNLN